MKLNAKQIDDIARCLGNVAVAAGIGLVVALTGHTPKRLTGVEIFWLSMSLITSLAMMLYIRSGKD